MFYGIIRLWVPSGKRSSDVRCVGVVGVVGGNGGYGGGRRRVKDLSPWSYSRSRYQFPLDLRRDKY